MWSLSILLNKKAQIDKLTVACHTEMPTTIHFLVMEHLEHLSGKLQNSVTDSISRMMTVLSRMAPVKPATAETASFQWA